MADGNGQGDFQSAFTDAQSEQASTPPPQPAPETPPVEQPPQETPPPQQATPDTPPVEQPPQQQEPQLSEIARLAQEAGLNVDGLSDADIFGQMAQQYQEVKPYAEYGQYLSQYDSQIREYLNQQQQQSQPAQEGEPEQEWSQEEYFKQAWQDPQWNDQWDYAEQHGIVRRGEDGFYEPVPGREVMAAPIIQQMNQALATRQQQWQAIMQGNPYEMFYEKLLEPMKHQWQADIEAAVEQRLASRDNQSMAERFEQENKDWLYQQSDNGQKLATEQGQRFYDEIDRLKAAGVTDPNTLLSLAKQLVNPQPQQQVTPQQQASQTDSPEVASEQKQTSFVENALAKARHSPSAGGATQPSPTDPVTVDETTLNNMFVSELQRSRAAGQ